MNWNEMRRKAVEHGFEFVAHCGKHDRYRNPQTGVTIMIERHWSQEVRTGLMNKLRKIIGF